MKYDLQKIIITDADSEVNGEIPDTGIDLLHMKDVNVQSVSGLGREDITIPLQRIANQNLSTAQTAYMQSREIGIEIAIKSESARNQILLAMPFGKKRRLFIVTKERAEYWIDVFPASMPIKIDVEKTQTTIQLIAPFPFFRSVERVTTKVTTNSHGTQVLENKGDVEAFVKFRTTYKSLERSWSLEETNEDGTQVASAKLSWKTELFFKYFALQFTKEIGGSVHNLALLGGVATPISINTNPGEREMKARIPAYPDEMDAGESHTDFEVTNKVLCNDESVNTALERDIIRWQRRSQASTPGFAPVVRPVRWMSVQPGTVTEARLNVDFDGEDADASKNELTYYHTFSGI